jgi:p-cumate 2,3-dioxygenase subunit alpha
MSTTVPATRQLPEAATIPGRSTAWLRDERDPNRFLVNRRAFIDEAVFEKERRSIFAKSWLYVGHASEVANPGDFVTRSVGGRPVLMTRAGDGRIRVLFNSCSHRGAEVCRDASGTTKRFRCFYHSWSFGIDGSLIAVPDQDAYPSGFDKADNGLRSPAHVDVYRDFVFCNFEPAAPSLEDYLAGAKFYLDLTADQSSTGMVVERGTHEYSVKANWKLLAENSSDGYHAVPVHKTYLDVQRRRGDTVAGNTQSDWKESHAYSLGNGHTVTVKEAPWGRPIARWKPSMGEDTRAVVEASRQRLVDVHGVEHAGLVAGLDFNMLIFPNLVINNIMAVIIRKFDPLSPGFMNVTAWSLAPQEEDAAARSVRNESFLSFLGPGGLATPDDNEALESCQRGYANELGEAWSDVSRGMDKDEPANYDELQMRTFWRRWDDLIGGTDA